MKNLFTLFLLFTFCITALGQSVKMKPMNSSFTNGGDYTMTTGLEAKNYVKKLLQGSIKISSRLQIESYYAMTVVLPNHEIVLMPGNSGPPFDTYPAFIFKDEATFLSYREKGEFPIPDKFKNGWELDQQYFQRLPDSITYFRRFLHTELGVPEVDTLTPLNYEKLIYATLATKLKTKKRMPFSKREKLLQAFFAVIAADWIENYNAVMIVEKRYNIYNSYNYYKVSVDGHLVDIYSSICGVFNPVLKDPFYFFSTLALEREGKFP